MRLKRVCIYGAGAIGGWLGVALAKAGCELSAVARGQTLAALQHGGLTLVHGDARAATSLFAPAAQPASAASPASPAGAVAAPAGRGTNDRPLSTTLPAQAHG